MSSIFSWRIGRSRTGIFFVPLVLMGGEFYLLPLSFEAAVGERLTVRAHYGTRFPISESAPVLADSGIYTAQAAYSLVNAHPEGNALVLEGSLKASGVAILTAESKPRIEGKIRYVDFAKAIVVVEKVDANFTRQLGAILEIVPMSLPARGFNQFSLYFKGKRIEEPIEMSDGIIRTRTDGRIRIETIGRYLLRTTHTEDGTVYSASLTFEVR